MLLKSLNVENHQAYQLAYLRKIRNYYDRKSFEHSTPGLGRALDIAEIGNVCV